MKFTRKQILITLAAFVGLAIVGVVGFFALIAYTFSSEYGAPSGKESAIKCTLEWGRLSAFPTSAQGFTFTVHGTMFTRAFRASFILPPTDIEQWLQQSPGTREALPTTPSPGVRHFGVAPDGGAQHAEVTVDDTEHRVSIYVYWS